MNGPADPHGPARAFARPPGGLVPWLLTAVCVVLAAGGESVRHLARYERAALEAGELWRLLTAHAVHLGWPHTLLNVAALGLVTVLLGDVLRVRDWLLGMLASMLAIDAGLYWLAPDVGWYVGLSGVLHGLVLIGAVRVARAEPRLAGIVLAGLAAKLVWEAVAGPAPWSEAVAAGPVVVAAHLYGALGAGAYLVVLRLVRRARRGPL